MPTRRRESEEIMPTRHKAILVYLTFYLLLLAIALRALVTYFAIGHPLRWTAAGLLLLFTGLMSSEGWLTQRYGRYPVLYLAWQTALVFSLLLLPPYLDFFATLFIPLSAQAMLFFPRRTGLSWMALFTLVTAVGLGYGLGWLESLPFTLLYGSAYLFVGSYASVTIQAETARQGSQNLLAELQTAHRQLQAYAAQVEELAVIQERNRLARELHDSVTQTIFSLTLTARAARLLLERDPARAAGQLDHLQELAQSALAEMRSLIFQLRPTPVEAIGLGPALQRHLTGLQSEYGLTVDLHLEGEPRLPPEQAARLFRIVQEALNNVVKHAQTDRAAVMLRPDNGRLILEITDQGVGFDPNTPGAGRGSLGLASMRERAEMMGGGLTVTSRPGQGVRLRIEIPQANPTEGESHHG
jgi:signal transduction histidine kinase